MLIASHQCHNEAATAEARKHKRNYSPTDFLRVIPADTVMSGNLLPPPPSPSPTPENLPRTALAPSQPNLHPRPSQASTIAQPAPSSHLAPTRPQHLPPTGPCSDPKRPRIPGTDSAPSNYPPWTHALFSRQHPTRGIFCPFLPSLQPWPLHQRGKMQLQVWPILLRAKVPTKVLQVKTPILPVGHP